MKEVIAPDPNAILLADQAFEAGQVIRARDRAIRELQIRNAEIARQHEGSAESQLAEATTQLRDRMVWLHEHPHLRKLIGRSAVDTRFKPWQDAYGRMRSHGALTTEPLPDGEVIEYRGESLLLTGLYARCYYPDASNHKSLYIDRQAEDVNTPGAIASQNLYELVPYHSETGPRVQVKGSGFDSYTRDAQRQIFLNYVYENPWAEKYGIYYRSADLSAGKPYGEFVGYDNWKEKKDLERLNTELAPKLERGGDWDYPDDMYLVPLGFVQQMNLYLGTKNK